MTKANAKETAAIAPASQVAIERFCDACWLEDGLAQNSLTAYRRDLLLLAQWLYKNHQSDLYAVTEKDLTAYIAHRRSDKATTANRRLTVFKRFYRHALRIHFVPHAFFHQAASLAKDNYPSV